MKLKQIKSGIKDFWKSYWSNFHSPAGLSPLNIFGLLLYSFNVPFLILILWELLCIFYLIIITPLSLLVAIFSLNSSNQISWTLLDTEILKFFTLFAIFALNYFLFNKGKKNNSIKFYIIGYIAMYFSYLIYFNIPWETSVFDEAVLRQTLVNMGCINPYR